MSRRDPCLTQYGKLKARYKDPANAKSEANRLSRVFNDIYDVYRCPNCRYHHVGRRGVHSMERRAARRLMASELHIELGERAAANLMMGDGQALVKRFAAARRRQFR